MCREKVGVGKTLTKNRLGCAMVANLAVRCPEHAVGGAGGAGAGASAAGAGSGSAAAGGASGGGRSGDNARSDSTTIGERRGWGVAFGAPSAAAAEGCTWTGKLSEWDQHATVCRFVRVRLQPPVDLPPSLESSARLPFSSDSPRKKNSLSLKVVHPPPTPAPSFLAHTMS